MKSATIDVLSGDEKDAKSESRRMLKIAQDTTNAENLRIQGMLGADIRTRNKSYSATPKIPIIK